MSQTDAKITVILRIARSEGRWTEHRVEVPEGSYVIDAIERVFAQPASQLIWRHACHHASCGTCGLRINGVEKLPCITPLSDYDLTRPIRLEPLDYFPRVGDLVVDFTPFFERMQAIGMPIICADETAPPSHPALAHGEQLLRFENCIECGLCISACPAMRNGRFLGPAALAAAERLMVEPRGVDVEAVRRAVDTWDGIWGCRSSYQCTAVCPMGVDPAGAIIRLRTYL
ncbi:MAG: 2Fe-2S iron-sulfur cluster-binding protein [Anaerolineae bacterium]|nr:2Fe-2S iron-sulfur cluster-binding protein [Thermoflexales bacterium]MDW8396190.1 2Fe-2S iron-sulfur cluster-binding protein [Anaerolineae bacterium]